MTETEIPSVTIEGDSPHAATPDSAMPDWLAGLPAGLQPFASLARWDRPVGVWLLVLPCWIGLAFTRIGMGWHWIDLWWAALFFVGAIAMRGAGCTWNDIMDQDLDAGVERTASRPLPSGQVTTQQAYIWLAAQVFVGFLVWLCLPRDAKYVALLAIPLVAAYPLMKRYTWWPQAWLGMTFNWGVLVAAATASYVSVPTVILWFALIAWTIAYDTIYALQDMEDDAVIGVKSTALLFGDKAVLGAFSFYVIAAAIAGFATWIMGAGRIGSLTMMAFLAHGVWQALRLSKNKDENALAMFKANVTAGFILLAGLAFAAIIGGDKRPQPASSDTVTEAPAATDLTTDDLLPEWMRAPVAIETAPAINPTIEEDGSLLDRWVGVFSGDPAPEEPQPIEAEAVEEAPALLLPEWMFAGDEAED